MLRPSATELMKSKKINSRYTLVIAAAKRAREIVSTGITFTECKSDKPVSIAVNESIMNDILEHEAQEKEENPDENA